MPFVLNAIYCLLVLVSLPWLVYSAITKGKYRQGWRQKLLGRLPERAGSNHCMWLHAVSVGEVNLLATLLLKLSKQHPNCCFYVTTTTRTGYQLAQQRYGTQATVCYCPLDFSWAVNEAMRRVRPDVLILAELELWPNLIMAANRSGARIAIINGRLSDKSFARYRLVYWFVSRMLRRIDLIGAQNPEYAQRFMELGSAPACVHVTGSLKFDGAQSDRGNSRTRELAKLWGVETENIVFLAGSTQAPEERLAIETFRVLASRFPQLRLIITPRHAERFEEVARVLENSGIAWTRRSTLSSPQQPGRSRVLLVDTIGELGAWWGLTDIAFVGGSLGSRGGQNMIEPAAYGAAVCFGPNTRNFRDIVALLLNHDAAQVILDGDELTQFVRTCLEDPKYRSNLGATARDLVRQQQGALQRTMVLLNGLLEPETAQPATIKSFKQAA